MALRLVEVYLPAEAESRFRASIESFSLIDIWHDHLSEDRIFFRFLLPAEKTEPVIDHLNDQFKTTEGFRAILLPVEANLPRYEPETTKENTSQESLASETAAAQPSRISREELYHDIAETTQLSRVFIIMVVLSSIVAAVGILQHNVAVVIGAMVIAPLLGPNVALALATTLGDGALARKALKTGVSGIAAAFLFSGALGVILTVDPTIPEIASRTIVGLSDIVLALAAGGAATLAFTTGVSGAVIGVMVAVALLPPLVTAGMLFGDGHWEEAFAAVLLLCSNIIAINLAGVVSFVVQGIRPTNWWEADKAKRAARRAVIVWSALLVVLIVIISLSQEA